MGLVKTTLEWVQFSNLWAEINKRAFQGLLISCFAKNLAKDCAYFSEKSLILKPPFLLPLPFKLDGIAIGLADWVVKGY